MDRTKTITIGDVCEIICKHCVKAHGGCSYKWNCPLLTEIAKYIDRKTENSSEKPNNFDKDINVRSKDEPHCYTCKYERRGCADEPCVDCRGRSKYEPKDEPQDEYAKEYEELGLRKLKELRKDEPQTNADQHVQHVGSVEPMRTEREGE